MEKSTWITLIDMPGPELGDASDYAEDCYAGILNSRLIVKYEPVESILLVVRGLCSTALCVENMNDAVIRAAKFAAGHKDEISDIEIWLEAEKESERYEKFFAPIN